MKKHKLLRFLEPFSDDIDIVVQHDGQSKSIINFQFLPAQGNIAAKVLLHTTVEKNCSLCENGYHGDGGDHCRIGENTETAACCRMIYRSEHKGPLPYNTHQGIKPNLDENSTFRQGKSNSNSEVGLPDVFDLPDADIPRPRPNPALGADCFIDENIDPTGLFSKRKKS